MSKELRSLVGAARINVTPEYAIRLHGYYARKTECTGVLRPIWARAIAFGGDEGGPGVLVSIENVGLPWWVTQELADRLARVGVAREKLAVTYTHTHYAPCLTGSAPFIFGEDLPREQQSAISKYTDEAIDAMEQAALAALGNRAPVNLEHTEGSVSFAANRRTPGGPVDHRLPILRAVDGGGNVRAVWMSYACHCTTYTPDENQIGGDWAGLAQDAIEIAHPDAVAVTTIGCAADANPEPRCETIHAQQHADKLIREVDRLMVGKWTPISEPLVGHIATVDLVFDVIPNREEWVSRTGESGPRAYHAQKFLERVDRGESLPETLTYPIQCWTFGDELAMLFLAGEVVVDYALALARTYDRLWSIAYSTDFPGYIPSERILAEGGYEGGDALIYFAQPTKFAPGVESRVLSTVASVLPQSYHKSSGVL